MKIRREKKNWKKFDQKLLLLLLLLLLFNIIWTYLGPTMSCSWSPFTGYPNSAGTITWVTPPYKFFLKLMLQQNLNLRSYHIHMYILERKKNWGKKNSFWFVTYKNNIEKKNLKIHFTSFMYLTASSRAAIAVPEPTTNLKYSSSLSPFFAEYAPPCHDILHPYFI